MRLILLWFSAWLKCWNMVILIIKLKVNGSIFSRDKLRWGPAHELLPELLLARLLGLAVVDVVEGGDAAVVPAHISGLQETRAVNDESSRSVTITVLEGPFHQGDDRAYSTWTVKLGEGRLVGWFLVLLLHHLGMWCRMGVASRSVWFSLWVSVWQTNISSRMTHILAPGVSTNIYLV